MSKREFIISEEEFLIMDIPEYQFLVRCKDCIYRNYDNCPFNEFSELYKPDDDFFCANGEMNLEYGREKTDDRQK